MTGVGSCADTRGFHAPRPPWDIFEQKKKILGKFMETYAVLAGICASNHLNSSTIMPARIM